MSAAAALTCLPKNHAESFMEHPYNEYLLQRSQKELQAKLHEAYELRERRRNVESLGSSLRDMIAEVADTVEHWRAEHQSTWVNRIRQLALQAESHQDVLPPSAVWCGGHTVFNAASGRDSLSHEANVAANTMQKRPDEDMLREEIEKLQAENRRLTADLARNCSHARTGGGAHAQRLQLAQRRVLECARVTQALEESTAVLRLRLEKMGKRHRLLEETFLRQRGKLEALRLSDPRPDECRRCDKRSRITRHHACAKFKLASHGGSHHGDTSDTIHPELHVFHPQSQKVDERIATGDVDNLDLADLEEFVAQIEATLKNDRKT